MQCAMKVFNTAPDDIRDMITKQMSAVNFPHVGAHENAAFTALQINIAAADPYTPTADAQSAASGLQEQLGQFGGFHVDEKDSAGGISSMAYCSDLPEGYDAGLLLFPEIGFGVYLEGFGGVNFCGQHLHGGTNPAPLTAASERKDWPTRLTIVPYTHAMPINGEAVMPVVPIPVPDSDSLSKSPLLGFFCTRPEYQLTGYVEFLLYLCLIILTCNISALVDRRCGQHGPARMFRMAWPSWSRGPSSNSRCALQ